NVESEVILYADVITNSIARAMAVTDARRERQLAHNAEHGITPTSIVKEVRGSLRLEENVDDLLPVAMVAEGPGGQEDAAAMLAHLEAEMREAAQALEFEKAASLRDQIQEIKEDYGL
ncbi:MAG: UvrB/UvrC motif-containing protein, partial [Candidatus Poribacteria bacterium]